VITIVLIIAHLIGDFMFQPQYLVKHKHTQKNALIKHAGIYAICVSIITFLSIPATAALYVSIIISLLHFLIDAAKEYIIRKRPNYDGVLIFTLDQTIHIITVFIVAFVVKEFSISVSGLISALINIYNGDTIDRGLTIFLIYTVCLSPAAVFIKKLLQKIIPNKCQNEDNHENIGFAIGILERLIILTLGLAGHIEAIGFIIAAKSLARFRQLSNKEFAEKYLIGTLTSVLIALICVFIGIRVM